MGAILKYLFLKPASKLTLLSHVCPSMHVCPIMQLSLQKDKGLVCQEHATVMNYPVTTHADDALNLKALWKAV